MLEINTIEQFLALPTNLRDEIQKSIRTKDRLDNWLRNLGNIETPKIDPHWERCKKCAKFDQPGWVWVQEYVRDNSDIHPSQISKCVKALWYACRGDASQLVEHIDPRLQMIFDIGHLWHSIVQRYGARGAWGPPDQYQAEVPIDPDAKTFDGKPVHPLAEQYWIKGHVDAVINRYEIDNVPGLGPVAIRLVHEYKTINSNQYSKLNRPKPEHKFQATIYAAVLNIPIVVYLYTNKDDCKTADFPVPFDHTIWAEVATKISTVQHYVINNETPPWEITSASKQQSECMDCGYRKLCQPPLKQLTGK